MTASVGQTSRISSVWIRLGLAIYILLAANWSWAISVSLTSPSNSVVAAPATITVSATATPGFGRRILRVDFFRGANRIGSDTIAPYSTVLSSVTAGTYVFTAIAIDSGGAIAVSDPVVVRVDNPPSVTLTSPAINAVFTPGTDVTVTASASDSEVVRKVEFFANGILIGTQVLSPYEITWSNVLSGRYTLTARATDLVGLATTSAPVQIDVGFPPTVAITNPASGATFSAPATITVTALVGDSDGTVARVEFFDGGTLVGTATASSGNSSYSATVSDLSAGEHTVTARAIDDQGFATISSPISITVSAGTAQMFYIHTDHLNTPRMIASQSGATVWRWDQTEPFGDNVPNTDPDRDASAFDFPLRFPGQYSDRETSLAYNFFRHYDRAIGRYIESDPVGQRGDSNLFAYANDNPLTYVDPDGKLSLVQCVAAVLIAYGGYKLWGKYSCQRDCQLDCELEHSCAGGNCPLDEGNTNPLNACKRVCFATCWGGPGKKGPMGPTPNGPPNNPPWIPNDRK